MPVLDALAVAFGCSSLNDRCYFVCSLEVAFQDLCTLSLIPHMQYNIIGVDSLAVASTKSPYHFSVAAAAASHQTFFSSLLNTQHKQQHTKARCRHHPYSLVVSSRNSGGTTPRADAAQRCACSVTFRLRPQSVPTGRLAGATDTWRRRLVSGCDEVGVGEAASCPGVCVCVHEQPGTHPQQQQCRARHCSTTTRT